MGKEMGTKKGGKDSFQSNEALYELHMCENFDES